MAHDFLGNELSIGDDVVFLTYNGTSADLKRGKITKVSEHTAEISGKKRRAEYKIIKVNPAKPTMDNTWIPISERLPGECGKYLAAVESEAFRGLRYVDILRYDGIGWRDGCCYVNGVSHWMPLPEPPEENECGEK